MSNVCMTYWDNQTRVDIGTALQCMASVLGEARSDFLLVSTVFGDDVGPGDCHVLTGPNRSLPSDEVMFNLARKVGAKEMLFGSVSSGPIDEVHEQDVILFDRLLEAVVRSDLKMLDHVLVAPGGLIRLMRESLFGEPEEDSELR